MVPRKTTTRERLITTAAELFRRQGYAQTGVNQIIQEANATSGSFYHFFPAKEDLLLAVVDHMALVFESEIFDPAADQTDDPFEELYAILELYRRQLQEEGLTFGSPMASLSAEVSENHPQVRSRLAEIFSAWTGRIESLLRKAGERMPKSLDHGSMAQLVICAIEGSVLGSRIQRSLEPFDAAVSQLKVCLDLLKTPSVVPAAVREITAPPRPTRAPAADWKSW